MRRSKNTGLLVGPAPVIGGAVAPRSDSDERRKERRDGKEVAVRCDV